MAVYKIIHYEETFAAGELKDVVKEKAEETYHIKHILFRRKDGKPLTGSTVTIEIDAVAKVKEVATAAIFGSDKLNALELDWDWPKAKELKIGFRNLEGETIDLYVDIVCVE